jgi:hypothetical protein
MRGIVIAAITAYTNRVISPHITKNQYARLLGSVGHLISMDKRALTVTFQPYLDPPDSESGRLQLVDDQGNDYFKCKRNDRSSDSQV